MLAKCVFCDSYNLDCTMDRDINRGGGGGSRLSALRGVEANIVRPIGKFIRKLIVSLCLGLVFEVVNKELPRHALRLSSYRGPKTHDQLVSGIQVRKTQVLAGRISEWQKQRKEKKNERSLTKREHAAASSHPGPLQPQSRRPSVQHGLDWHCKVKKRRNCQSRSFAKSQ